MDTTRKEASQVTIEANQKVLNTLPFDEKTDFINARRNLIAKDDELIIKDEDGNTVWDMESYKSFIGLNKPAPETVNPSLWRNAQLCMIDGLFQVAEGIYQVRGYDLSNMTFVEGETGWILFDVLTSKETAKAALDLVNRTLSSNGRDPRPVVAVVYSHSHLDHFGGIRGIVDQRDVRRKKVKIYAPEGFTEAAVSENVIAGNAMGRRAIYMYGALLPRDSKGSVNSGLGQTNSTGEATLITPTNVIGEAKAKLTHCIDGVKVVFQLTPGTEAPSEMNTWFPDKKALWMAENTTNTMHNILTLRGAEVRDALEWAKYLNETIDRWGDQANVKFQSHHWPVWGNSAIQDYLKKQRDVYKYIHDQSVRLMNKGYIGSEISEMIALPAALEDNWSTRGYYGTLRHNSRAVYQKYMGWYSSNPSDLDNLPPTAAAQKYVEYMGGESSILAKAQQDFDEGNYRWVAEVLKHVVFSSSCQGDAADRCKELLADSYEQLGYQAESGPWRSEYLQGAWELRNGVDTSGGLEMASPDIIKNMEPEMLFDYLAVQLNPEKAEGEAMTINFLITDLGEAYTLSLENSVLNYTTKLVTAPDATLESPKSIIDKVLLGKLTPEQAAKRPRVHISGDASVISKFLGLLDTFDMFFNIVTP